MSGHVCSQCGAEFVERPSAGQAPEQKWCGTWYDHPEMPKYQCLKQTSTALVPSPELLASQAQHQLPIAALDGTA